MHEVPFKAKNNREAVVVCAIHVVKRPSKRSVLVYIYIPSLPRNVEVKAEVNSFSIESESENGIFLFILFTSGHRRDIYFNRVLIV